MRRAPGDRFAAALAFAVPLLVYALSAYRDVGFWDVGEMDTVPWILGIAHPTGFPAYVLIGWLFSHVVPIGSVAFRMSLLSAVGVSAACWLLARIVDEEWNDAWLGTGCAWLFAFGLVAWTRATRAEVHALAICAVAATLLFALRWLRAGRERDAYVAAAACGCGIAVHPAVALLLPGLLLLAIARLAQTRSRTIVLSLIVLVAAALPWFAYLPLRSAYVVEHRLDPALALGLPPGGSFWNTDDPRTPSGFLALVTGSDFNVERGTQAMIATHTYATALPRYAVPAVREFTVLGIGLALFGLAIAFRIDRTRASFLVLCGFLSVPFALGFRDESDVERYFLPSFFVGAIFIGDGLGWLAQRFPRAREIATALPTLLAAVLVFQQHWLFRQAHDDRARAIVTDVLASTPDNAVLIATWVGAPPLAYAAYVEHDLGARSLDAAWLAEDAYYVPGWAKHRPVYVVGQPYGSVPGFRIEPVAGRAYLYRLVHE